MLHQSHQHNNEIAAAQTTLADQAYHSFELGSGTQRVAWAEVPALQQIRQRGRIHCAAHSVVRRGKSTELRVYGSPHPQEAFFPCLNFLQTVNTASAPSRNADRNLQAATVMLQVARNEKSGTRFKTRYDAQHRSIPRVLRLVYPYRAASVGPWSRCAPCGLNLLRSTFFPQRGIQGRSATIDTTCRSTQP